MIRQMVQCVRAFLGTTNHRASYYQGVNPFKLQIVFGSDSDAIEAARLFEGSHEARDCQNADGLDFYRGILGQYRVDGIDVSFLGPVMHIER